MDFKEVDLAVALRAVSFHRMNIARKVRREMKRQQLNMKVLGEQSELEGALMLISHNTHQLRQSFRKIKKLEKRIKERKNREKHPMEHTAGRNRSNFTSR